jgi:two-component system response regulator HydG
MPRILVVDDEPANRITLERILSREGLDVDYASDGRAALEVVREGGVDVVLTDLKMPGMSGLELLRAIHALAPDIEVALMTAYGTVETAVEAMKGGPTTTSPSRCAATSWCGRSARRSRSEV